MRWMDIEMLLRTMATQSNASGVEKLEGRAGLRLVGPTDSVRGRVASIFKRCLSEER